MKNETFISLSFAKKTPQHPPTGPAIDPHIECRSNDVEAPLGTENVTIKDFNGLWFPDLG